MDDSMINPTLLSSSVYLKNVEKLIQNLEEQTLKMEMSDEMIKNDENFLNETMDNLNSSFDQSDGRNDHPPISNTEPSQAIHSESTSWRQMKASQKIITEIESKKTPALSSLSLYQIFQQKCNVITPSYSNEEGRSNKPANFPLSSLHKSLPDLSFISHYSKKLPRSQTTSPSASIVRTTPSPVLIHQQKQDFDRPRTLKSIKRYKNSKHSTEPLNVFPPVSTTVSQFSCAKNLHILFREHHSENDLLQSTPNAQLSEQHKSTHQSSNQLSRLTQRSSEKRRCQTDIILVDHCSLTDSPPNEFHWRRDEESFVNTRLNLDDPMPISTQMNSSILDHLVERINDVIKELFEIKRSEKIFFLNNELNVQLDSLLKKDLCSAIETILEHGRKEPKRVNLWKIIQISTSSPAQTPRVYFEAKQLAQNASSFWLHRFQAFIFALLNQNELINWLYYFTRQKDLLQRYYQSPDALILVSISSTFNFFERIMTQLEKLTSLKFHLTYHDEQFHPSTNPRDWVMTLSRRTAKSNSNDTFRSTLTKKFTAIFTKTNSSVIASKLPRSIYPPYSTIGNGDPLIIPYQSKLPRASLNVDKPKSVRYRSATLPSK